MKIQSLPNEPTPSAWKQLLAYLNTILRTIRFGENLDGQIVENITIPNGSSVRISHNLKTTPLYCIILRQRGNGKVTDSNLASDAWTDSYITQTNWGPSDVTVTVLIMRG